MKIIDNKIQTFENLWNDGIDIECIHCKSRLKIMPDDILALLEGKYDIKNELYERDYMGVKCAVCNDNIDCTDVFKSKFPEYPIHLIETYIKAINTKNNIY